MERPRLVDLNYSYTRNVCENDSKKVARITKITDVIASTSITYCYDKLNRLKSATDTGGNDFDYEFDENSNVKKEWLNGAIRNTFTYLASNELDERTTNGGVVYAHTHDAAGNLENIQRTDTNTMYLDPTYNVASQATSILDADSTGSMSYSGPGQFDRLTKGSTTFVNDMLGVSSEKTGGTTTQYIRDNQGRLISMRRSTSGGTWYNNYYITDHLGSVLETRNEDASRRVSYTYEPFGRTTVHAAGDGTTLNQPWRWAGGYQDDEVGLYKFGTRYYRPEILRFTQPDPTGPSLYNPITHNRWQYAGGNPVLNSDPSGQTYFNFSISLGFFSFDYYHNFDTGEDHVGVGLGLGLGAGGYFGEGSVEGGQACASATLAVFSGASTGGCTETGGYGQTGGGLEAGIGVQWIF